MAEQCTYHPGVETALRCRECDKPICPQCMVYTPVGVKCRECARLRKMPPYDVTLQHYVRGGLAGLGIGVASGILLGLLMPFLVYIPFLPWLAFVGMGYAVGEGVSVATNHKRGSGLVGLVVVSFILSYVISSLFYGTFLLGSLFGLLILAAALYVAVSRVR
ncbi:MAG: B-box zinc finger protein [Dehalococcoidia bacterium]